MVALMLALKEAKIKAEAIPVHMNQVKTATKQIKDNGEIPTVMVHAGKSTKLQHYYYPQRNSGGSPHHRIMTLYILVVFYLIHRRHQSTPNN